MEYIRIQSVQSNYAKEIIDSYLNTFPEEQRHLKEDFIALLGSKQNFHCRAVLMNNTLIGFVNFWEFDDFIYLEHLAVEPPLRGHKLGEKLVKQLQSETNKTIVLEAEKADDSEFAERRLDFYRRLGFEIIPTNYRQPPYRKNADWIELEILSDKLDFALTNFEHIRNTIYREVYGIENETI